MKLTWFVEIWDGGWRVQAYRRAPCSGPGWPASRSRRAGGTFADTLVPCDDWESPRFARYEDAQQFLGEQEMIADAERRLEE